jgi:hypothetical protein
MERIALSWHISRREANDNNLARLSHSPLDFYDEWLIPLSIVGVPGRNFLSFTMVLNMKLLCRSENIINSLLLRIFRFPFACFFHIHDIIT